MNPIRVASFLKRQAQVKIAGIRRAEVVAGENAVVAAGRQNEFLNVRIGAEIDQIVIVVGKRGAEVVGQKQAWVEVARSRRSADTASIIVLVEPLSVTSFWLNSEPSAMDQR